MSMVASKRVYLVGDSQGGHTLRHSRQILPLLNASQQPEPHWSANGINAEPAKSRKSLQIQKCLVEDKTLCQEYSQQES